MIHCSKALSLKVIPGEAACPDWGAVVWDAPSYALTGFGSASFVPNNVPGFTAAAAITAHADSPGDSAIITGATGRLHCDNIAIGCKFQATFNIEAPGDNTATGNCSVRVMINGEEYLSFPIWDGISRATVTQNFPEIDLPVGAADIVIQCVGSWASCTYAGVASDLLYTVVFQNWT